MFFNNEISWVPVARLNTDSLVTSPFFKQVSTDVSEAGDFDADDQELHRNVAEKLQNSDQREIMQHSRVGETQVYYTGGPRRAIGLKIWAPSLGEILFIYPRCYSWHGPIS